MTPAPLVLALTLADAPLGALPPPDPPAPTASQVAAPANAPPAGPPEPDLALGRPLTVDARRARPRSTYGFVAHLASGGSYYRIHDIPAFGVGASVALGGMTEHVGWSFEGSLFGGQTDGRLAVTRASFGPNLEVHQGHFGLGLGFAHVWTIMSRHSSDATIDFMTTAGVARATWDAKTWERGRALYFGVRGFAGTLPRSLTYTTNQTYTTNRQSAAIWDVALFLGYRYRS